MSNLANYIHSIEGRMDCDEVKLSLGDTTVKIRKLKNIKAEKKKRREPKNRCCERCETDVHLIIRWPMGFL